MRPRQSPGDLPLREGAAVELQAESQMVADDDEQPETSDEIDKLRRRFKRNLRKAGAEGFLAGVAAMLRPGDLVLDCGANVGKVTQLLATTGARVLAYEPDPFAFSELSKSCTGLDNVTLNNVAVGVSEGSIRLMRASNFEANPTGASVKSTIVGGGRMIDEAEGINVKLISFPDLVRKLSDEHGEIALVKMDIEGAELDILEALESEGLLDPIRCMIVETHERKFKALRPRYRSLRERLAEGPHAGRIYLDWI